MFRNKENALHDLANMAGGAMNIATSLKAQIRNDMKSRMDERIADMDMVPREDFDALEARVKKLEQLLTEKK